MSQKSDNDEECAVCLQKYLQPIILPCRHVFCYLCAKGMSTHGKRCALCRKKIPDDYLLKPIVLNNQIVESDNQQHIWYYQGNQGWWQYDERTNTEVEGAFKEGKQAVKVMISGFIYVVDFQKMVQYREQYPQRLRAIKRDLVNIPDMKGVAGLSLGLLQTAALAGADPGHSSWSSSNYVGLVVGVDKDEEDVDDDDDDDDRHIIGEESEFIDSDDGDDNGHDDGANDDTSASLTPHATLNTSNTENTNL